MFGQQRSQSGPSGLSINTGSANLFGSSSQAPAAGGVVGTSKPLFGSSLNAATAAPSGGLFGTSITNQGGLFGTPSQSMPPKPALSLFNSMGQEQSTGGNTFGTIQGQNQAASNQQQQQGGNIFGNLNKPSSTGTHAQGLSQQLPSFGQQLPSFTSQPSNATYQQPQKSNFSSSIGQYTQQQQSIPGVRVDISGLKSTTRFNDLYEEVQKIIENVDNFVLGQTQFAEECELAMPKIESALEYTPGDVEFCSRKLDALQQSLENDASAIDSCKNLVKIDATDAKMSFRTIQNLRMPQQFQHTGLWGAGSTSQSTGPALHAQGEDGGSTDLVSYFTKQAEGMEKNLETLKTNLTEVETYLKGVEASTMQQLQRVHFTRGRDGGQRSADDQIRELAAVLREFENGILGVAGKVGGVREQVQEVMLSEGVKWNGKRGLY